MLADFITRTNKTLEERGLPAGSYFAVEFADGSTIDEKQTNWSFFSSPRTVEFGYNKIVVYVATVPIKKISVFHNGMEATIDDIPAGTDVYQFVRSERLLAVSVDKHTILGRGIGLLKNEKVVEEKFINAIENRVMGMRI